jgi:pimeloyl-ACP methyl ester carboxylesterase
LGTPPDVVATASSAEQTRVATIMADILPISQCGVGLPREPRLTVAPLSRPLDQIRLPTLINSSEDDLYGTWKNAQLIKQGIPNTQFVGFPSGGHLLVRHSEEVTAAVALFLNENATGSH